MFPHEIAVFMKERKLEYYGTNLVFPKINDMTRAVPAFGFAATLLESTPLLGLFFTISNRIGACMWAFGTSNIHLRVTCA